LINIVEEALSEFNYYNDQHTSRDDISEDDDAFIDDAMNVDDCDIVTDKGKDKKMDQIKFNNNLFEKEVKRLRKDHRDNYMDRSDANEETSSEESSMMRQVKRKKNI
jgi:hypothetical protein